jgi:hypothetical protein
MTLYSHVLAHFAGQWKAKGFWEHLPSCATKAKKAKATNADLLREGSGPSGTPR